MHRRARHLNPGSAGAVMALDSRFITGLSDGDPVSTWSDRSGSGNNATQSTSADRPVFQTTEQGGCPAVEFTASLKQLITPSVTLAQPAYYMACGRQLAVPQPFQTGRYLDAFSPGANIAAYQNKLNLYSGSGLNGTSNLGTSAHLASGLVNTTSSSLFLDGIQEASGNAGSTSGTGTISIGADRAKQSSFGYLNGHIYSAIYIPNNPGNPLRRRLEHATAFSFKIPCS